jgi:hypothetical protein
VVTIQYSVSGHLLLTTEYGLPLTELTAGNGGEEATNDEY